MCHSLLLNSMETANEGQGKRNISTTLLLDRHWQGKKTKSLQGIIVFRRGGGEKGKEQKECVRVYVSCVKARVCFRRPASSIGLFIFFLRPLAVYLSYSNSLRWRVCKNTQRFACAACAIYLFLFPLLPLVSLSLVMMGINVCVNL